MKKIWFLLTTLTFLLVACSFSEPEGSTASQVGTDSSDGSTAASFRDEIRVGLDVDATKLDTRLASDSSSKRITEMVYSGLVYINGNLEPEPALASSWENPDELTWIFSLRDDVTFHDGKEFTAEDVKFTFDTILDPDFQSNSLAIFSSISSVEVLDDYKVQFNLSEPYAPLLSYIDIGIVPKHIGESDPETLSTKPVGTGPYKFVEWQKNSKIVLGKFDGYWGDTPKTSKITYFIIPDNTTRVASLEAGDVDIVHSPLSGTDIERLHEAEEFEMTEMEGLGYTYLNFNVSNEKLSDTKIRQALSHFVNKEVISNTIYRGMDKPGVSPLIPASWAYTDDVAQFAYDTDKGKALLKELGYEDTNGDGYVEKGGVTLEIQLSTHTEDPNRIQTVEYLQNEFSKNGVKTSVSTTEWSTFSSSLMDGKYEIALLGWLGLTDPDRAVFNQFYSESGSNYGKYNNPRVDELLMQGRSNSDQEQRKTIYKEIANIINEELPYNVVLYQGYINVHTKKLTGFTAVPNGSLFNLIYASVEK